MKVGLGLGSNVGDRLQHLQHARAFLSGLSAGGWLVCSPVYETQPVDCPTGADAFLNAVVEIDFAGEPRALLAQTQQYERRQGRDPQAGRNAPRVIDIDILYFGQAVVRAPDLVIPHPRMTARRFVLEPLARIRPDLAQPWLAALPVREGEIRLLQTDW